MSLRMLMSLHLWHISIISNVVASLKVLQSPTEATRCVASILAKYTSRGDTVLSVNNNVKISGNPVIYRDTNNPLEVEFSDDFKISTYVIAITDDSNSEGDFKHLYSSRLLNPRGTFIILPDFTDPKALLKVLLKYFIAKVVLIHNATQLHTYSIEGTKLDHKYFGSCLDIKNLDIFQNSTKFNELTTLKALWVPYAPFLINRESGIVIEMLNMLAAHLHKRIQYYRSSTTNEYGHPNDKSIFKGIWKELAEGDLDLYCGLIVPDSTEVYYFDMTYPCTEDKSSIAVPMRMEYNDFNYVFGVYSQLVWVMIVLSFTALCILWYASGRALGNPQGVFLGALLMVLRILFENTTTMRSSLVTIRMVLALTLYSSLVLNTAFKAKYFKLQMELQPRQVIKSESDIVLHNLSVGLHQVVRKQLIESGQPHLRQMAENSVFCDTSIGCLNRTAFHKDSATVKMSKALAYYIPRLYVDDHGRSLLYVIPGLDISVLHFSLYFRRGHPLFSVFEKHLLTMRETGLILALYRDVERKNEKAMKLASKYEKVFQKVKFRNLNSVFLVYSIGIGICCVVFFLEYFRIKLFDRYSWNSR